MNTDRRPSQGWQGKISRLAAAACLAGGIVSFVPGCSRPLPSQEFLRRYERQALVREERGDFAFLILYQSPEYLSARHNALQDGRADLDSLGRSYARAHYVGFTVRIARGEGAPLKRMPGLQAALQGKAYLEIPGGIRVAPQAIAGIRALVPDWGESFLIAFPREHGGIPIDIGSCDFVVEDFGLNIGTLRHRVSVPKRLRLKADT